MEMGRKALIITGKGVQDHEFIYPYYRLREEGFTILVVLEKAEPKQPLGYYGTNIPPDEFCLIADYNILKSKLDNYDLLILPGGAKCMEYLRQNEIVLNFIKNFKGWIGTICHGTQLLISAGRTKGLKISGYYSIKDDIINSGAEYIDGVIASGKIISAPHYKYLEKWMKKILEMV